METLVIQVPFLPLTGRVLLAMIFLVSGVNKVLHPGETKQFMASHGMPFVNFFFWSAAVVEIIGGLSILLGFQARIGALLLALYLIPTTLIFHTNFADQNQQFHFMKNLAIIGGLLLATYFGAGPISLDTRFSGESP